MTTYNLFKSQLDPSDFLVTTDTYLHGYTYINSREAAHWHEAYYYMVTVGCQRGTPIQVGYPLKPTKFFNRPSMSI